MRILLIINKKKKYSKKIINIIKKNFKNCKIIDHNQKLNKQNNFDYVISYLSKKILKKKFLNKTKKYNINLHPGPSKYPGIGSIILHFFVIKLMVIAHIMNEKIDNGKIIYEKKFKINKNYDVKKLLNRSYLELVKLLKIIVKNIKNNNIKFSNIKWKRKAYTRKELNKLSEIKLSDSKKIIQKKIRSTYFEGAPLPFIIIKGIKIFINIGN